MPEISVIVPAFNAHRTLRETMESVIKQTFSDWEAIIVDDGSTDATVEVAKEIAAADGRVRVISQSNTGVSGARNHGLAEARGRYVATLDADDLWVERKLEWQLREMADRTVVVGGVLRFVGDGAERTWTTESLPPVFEPTMSPWLRVALLPSTSMVLINTMLAPREQIRAVGGWNTRLSTAEDWDLWLRLAPHCRFHSLQTPLQLYRKHAASATAGQKTLWTLEQHLAILEAFSGDKNNIEMTSIRRAQVARLMESLGIVNYAGDKKAATAVLWRAAGFRQSWRQPLFYYRAFETLVPRFRGANSSM